MQQTSLTQLSILCICLVSLTGCGSGFVPAGGVIRYADGSPATNLEGGSVSVESIDSKHSARGVIDSSGRFKLGTRTLNDGLPPGQYKALVVAPVPLDDPDDRTTTTVLIDPKYSHFDKSELTVTIPPGGTNDLSLVVTPPVPNNSKESRKR